MKVKRTIVDRDSPFFCHPPVYDQKKLAEEKEEKSEGIWDLAPAVMEKAEHAFSGQRAQQAVNC